MSIDPADRRPIDLTPGGGEGVLSGARLGRVTWAFVALGVGLRVARYLLNYPLWWDEAFVAVNFLRRGYLGLLRPLDYGQVCPALFLWVELTAVKVLGFSEWSLRFFPLACALASVFLFRAAAGLVVRGVPLLLAVAVFAVSFHPIRHAADLKPYSADLLAALAILSAGLAWWRSPGRSFWLWVLAGVAPVALAISHPAVFVAGGVGLAMAPEVVRTRSRRVALAYSAALAATGGTFVGLFAAFTGPQAAATLPAMQAQWGKAFPPMGNPTALARWAVTAHTGSMFAYPCGGDRGASALTLALFLTGAVVLCRRGRPTVAVACLAPFLFGLVAAGMRRYPYGGVAHGSPARVMQYLAPSICVLTGLGAAALWVRIPGPRLRLWVLRVGLGALVVVGVAPVVGDAGHPYRAAHAEHARRFARSLWPELARGGDAVCLRGDLGLGDWNSTNLNVAVYLCNRRIYAPARPPHSTGPRPLRCVLSLSDPEDGRVAARVAGFAPGYEFQARKIFDVNMSDSRAAPRVERYVIYEFAPPAIPRLAATRTGPPRR